MKKTPTFDPPTSAVEPPADINDFSAHSDYYRSDSWGLDSVRVATFEKNKENKTVHWFAEWKLYKNNPMPPERIEEHKTHPLYSYNKLKGLGLIVGIVKYGPNKGRWINFFDADSEKGKEVILKILGYDSVDNLKRDCVVEHHPSAPNKFHVFALSEVLFDNFSGLTTDREKVNTNKIPGFEIKSRGSGLAYVTPSLYDGPIEDERYQLVEGSVPAPARLFTEDEVSQWEHRLEDICQLYGTSSFDSNGKVPMSDLLSPDFVVTKGNNRKNYVLRVGMHYLKEDEETAEEETKLWNEEHCIPPLSYDVYREFSDAWAWANKYHERNKKKEEEEKPQKQRTKQQQVSSSKLPDYDTVVKESCEHILTKYPIVTIWETGQMYYFRDGKYVHGAERIIEEECFALFQYDAKSYMVEEVKKKIKVQTYHDLSEFDANPNIIIVKNGLYHIKVKTLTVHTLDYLSLNQKPIIYDPNGQCPEFDKFEDGCLYPSQIKTVNQCAAATFYRGGNLYEHYVIHVGRGWNGKSKLNNTMEKMHGSENVSHVPFNDISKDRFALADLENKDLNIDNEPSGGVIRNTAILKKLSSKQTQQVQQSPLQQAQQQQL
jgi:putative DNA primase/helicase